MNLPETAVIAHYIESEEKVYQGNPLIEALPPKVTQEQLKNYLKKDNVDEFCTDDNDITRYHKIINIIDGFFQPLSNHIQLEMKLSLMIRKGYIGRNINKGDLQKRLRSGYEQIKSGGDIVQFGNVQSTAQSTLFIGGSGLGKTAVLNRLLASYPQVIYHPKYNQVQLTYIKVDCPHDGTLKSLCIHFFTEIDKALGENYQVKTERWGIEKLVSYMAHVATKYAIGILVIDEIQNLKVAKAGGKEKMLSFLGSLVNVINIPVLLVGTPKAKQVMMDNFMYARRSTGAGALEWAPLKTSVQKKQSEKSSRSEWQAFTDRLWSKQFLHNALDKLSEPMRDTWFECSQGIIDVVIKLFVFTQIRAIITKQERITPRLMKKVFESEFGPIHPMIDALKSGDPDRIAIYSDLYLDNSLSLLSEKERLFSALAKQKKTNEKFGGNKSAWQLYYFLLDLAVQPIEAKALVELVLIELPDAPLDELLTFALECKKEKRHLKSRAKTTAVKALPESSWKELDGQDLRYIYTIKEADLYDELVERELVYNFVGVE